jgi:hypothetical protein
MSNTAPLHCRFTIKQVSHYCGFGSFKNWDTLHNVCQPNFSFIQPTNLPLELGQVTNIKKARSNKTPIDHPTDLLEAFHCDIGYGDTQSANNSASYCMLFINSATGYSWIYALKIYLRESIRDRYST